MKKAEFGQLPVPVQDYLLYLEAIKGHSELSVIEYVSDLRTFFRYLAKEKNLYPPDTPDDQMDLRQINMDFIKTITLSDAYQFLIYCKNQRGNAEATRARRVIAIRRFFIYLTDNRHLLEENPMKVLDAPKTKSPSKVHDLGRSTPLIIRCRRQTQRTGLRHFDLTSELRYATERVGVH